MVFLLSENTKADSQKFLELSLPELFETLVWLPGFAVPFQRFGVQCASSGTREQLPDL